MKKILLSLFICAGFITSLFAQVPVTNFSGNPTTVCAGQSVTWANLTTGATTYTWSFPGAAGNTTSNLQTPAPKTYNTPGSYTVTLIASNANGNDTMKKANYITVLPTPTITVTPSSGNICTLGSVTLAASGGNSYLWSPSTGLDNTTGSTVVAMPSTSVTYTVTGTNLNGCAKKTNVTVNVTTAPPPMPGGITGLTTVCNGQAGVVYSVPNIGNPAPVRTWTVPPGATITAGQGTRSITVTLGNTSGNVCCTASNACGSSAPSCRTITVNPTPQVGAVGSITGPTVLCGSQTGVTYFVGPVANATTYSWTTTGTASVTAGQGTNTVTINFGTTNSSVCVSASNACNTSAPMCKTVTVSTGIPATPGVITGPTTVCNGQTGVGYSVASVASTTYYLWTVPTGASITAGQGTRFVTVTFGSASGNVCVSDSNFCGKSAASCQAIAVDVNSVVGTISTITGPTTVCGNQSTVTYAIAPVTGASTYSWSVPAGASITAGQGTGTISVTYSVTGGNVCVSASNSCSSTQKCTTVSLTNIPATPGAITGPATVCNGQTGVVYTVPNTGTPAPVRTWTVPSDATITAGQGTRSVTVTFGVTSGTVCCTASNACGTSASSCQAVTVDPNNLVGTIGTITGPTTVCGNQSTVTYAIAPVTGASTYSWSVPAGASITAGQGTGTISVTYSVTGGNVCVSASNSCSSTQKCTTVSLTNIPATPGAITGPATVCKGQTGVVYTVPNTGTPAPIRTWTIPSDATITAGQGTRSVTVTFGVTSGTVCCTASNACGTSASSCQAVTVDPNNLVGTIGTITGPTTVCGNQSTVTYAIAPVTGASTYSWSVPAGASITGGQGTETISITYSVTGGNVCVSASNSCSSTQKCMAVSLTNIPATPGAITGPTAVCNGQTGVVYTVPNTGNPAPVRTWTVPSGASITAGQGTRSVTVTFGAASGTVCCTASNACGTSASSCQVVTVDPNPAVGTISTITGPVAVCANQAGVIYSIPSVTGASTYTWTVPSGASITAGQGTQTITVTYSVTAGSVCVKAGNSCSTSPQKCLAVAVSPTVATTPGAISGATTVCSGQVGPYSITPVTNALSYTWTVPTGAVVTSGQGTSNTTITFGAASGTICVSAVNGCGTSAQNCKPLVVDPAVLTVTTTVTNTTDGSLCNGSSTATPSGGSGPYMYAWTPSGATTSTATGLCYGSHTVCVTNAGGCVTCKTVLVSSPVGVSALTDNGTIHVFPTPANDYVFVEGTLSSSATLHISVLNLFGQKMIEESVYADRVFSQKVNIQGIPSGVYFIEIRSGEMVRNTKIMKIE